MCNGILQSAMLRGSTTRSLSDGEMIAAAAGAGAISAIVYSPVDLLTIQQQKLHLNLWDTTKTLVKQHGITGLYRGFLPCVAREALYTAGYLGLAPVITTRLVDDVPTLKEHPLAASIIGACTAGTLAAGEYSIEQNQWNGWIVRVGQLLSFHLLTLSSFSPLRFFFQ
jgi:hypothetical protein